MNVRRSAAASRGHRGRSRSAYEVWTAGPLRESAAGCGKASHADRAGAGAL